MNRKPRAITALLLCTCLLVLGGCNKEDKNKADNDKSSEETKAINEGEYSALLPFSVSDAGQKHAQMQRSIFPVRPMPFEAGNIWITIPWMPPRITAVCWGEQARKMPTV